MNAPPKRYRASGRIVVPLMTEWITARVARITADGDRVRIIGLEHAEGQALPAYTAGAHIDVHAGGHVRQYSLTRPSGIDGYEIGVLLDEGSRGGSAFMHQACVGDLLRISGPRNLFPLAQDAGRSLLIGGGIGITPLLAMAGTLFDEGRSFELHYCARSRSAAAFLDRLERAPWADHVHLHFDDGADGQRLSLETVLVRSGARHLYVCGPSGLNNAVLDAARGAGWAEASLHWEAFAASPPARSAVEPFEVQLASTGRIITVGRDESVADALARHGIGVDLSCGQGICGACVTGVISGTPEHNDYILTDEERSRCFTPCCSRARTPRLVLDL